MKLFVDATCTRCGARTSFQGVSAELVKEIETLHTCADGVMAPLGNVTSRYVPGPGERTKLPEERE